MNNTNPIYLLSESIKQKPVKILGITLKKGKELSHKLARKAKGKIGETARKLKKDGLDRAIENNESQKRISNFKKNFEKWAQQQK